MLGPHPCYQCMGSASCGSWSTLFKLQVITTREKNTDPANQRPSTKLKFLYFDQIREAAKRYFFLVARPLRGGGKGLAKKNFFQSSEKKEFPKKMWPLSSAGRGGGFKKNFFAASLWICISRIMENRRSETLIYFGFRIRIRLDVFVGSGSGF